MGRKSTTPWDRQEDAAWAEYRAGVTIESLPIASINESLT